MTAKMSAGTKVVSSAEPEVEESTPRLLSVSEPAVLLSPREEPMLGSLLGFYIHRE